MRDHFTSIEEVEKILSARFSEHIATPYFVDHPQEAEPKFIAYDIFPSPGWGVIQAGTSLAERTGDPKFLHDMLSKIVSLLYRSDSQFNDKGIGMYSGYDYSVLVDVAIYAAAQKRMRLVRNMFGVERPLSRVGYPPIKHAANLLVGILNPLWEHGKKARSQAEQFVTAKSNSKIDKAFVRYFLGINANDSGLCLSAITEFAQLYCRSDWGRYKPFTKPVFLYGLLSIANECYPNIVQTGKNIQVLGDVWSQLWTKYEDRFQDFNVTSFGFTGNLSFLNVSE